MVEDREIHSPTLRELRNSYARHLRAEGKAPATEKVYLRTLDQLDAYLAVQGMPRMVAAIRREHIEAYLDHQRQQGKSAASLAVYFRCLQPFWKWVAQEGEAPSSPMANMKAPKVPETSPPILSPADIQALLATVRGRGKTDIWSRRDYAIIRVLLATGIRLGELLRLRVGDVDFDAVSADGRPVTEVFVRRGKGGRPGRRALDEEAAEALDRYLRLRGRDKPEEPLWVGAKGQPLGESGVSLMLRRRCRQAGLPPNLAHPHAFRHLFAHNWLSDGRSETALERLMDWHSPLMVRRYARATAHERALAADHEARIGNRYR